MKLHYLPLAVEGNIKFYCSGFYGFHLYELCNVIRYSD